MAGAEEDSKQRPRFQKDRPATTLKKGDNMQITIHEDEIKAIIAKHLQKTLPGLDFSAKELLIVKDLIDEEISIFLYLKEGK